jgi:4-amino-4-deoxy-L-arabinose transferase-like glycosyltransferase
MLFQLSQFSQPRVVPTLVAGVLVILIHVVLGLTDSLNPSVPLDEPDSWEYQTVAVNYAVFNEYPVMGYLGDSETYQLNLLRADGQTNILKCMFNNSGPIIHVAKPPLYGLLLGITYRFFGVGFGQVFYLNLLFLYITVCCMIGLFWLLKRKIGFLLGVASAFIYVGLGSYNLSSILPEVVLTCLLSIIALFSISLFNSFSLRNILFTGIACGLAFLTKGVIIFVLVLIPIFAFITFGMHKSTLTKVCLFLLVVATTIAPWTFFSNQQMELASVKRNTWLSKLQTSGPCPIQEITSGQFRGVDLRQVIIDQYASYARYDNYLIISNQFSTERLLETHNPYCIDGEWHLEWKYLQKDPNLSQLTTAIPRVLSFYYNNPSMLYLLPIAKMALGTDGKYPFFLLGMFVLGVTLTLIRVQSNKMWSFILITSAIILFGSLCHNWQFLNTYVLSWFVVGIILNLTEPTNDVPPTFLIIFLNSIAITIIFFGNPRFVVFTEPIVLISIIHCLNLLREKTHQKMGVPQRSN